MKLCYNLKSTSYYVKIHNLTLTETNALKLRFNEINQKMIHEMFQRQYINNLKIDKTRQMLHDSDDISIQEICEILNFYSLPYFYKVFKEHTGMTPMKYRQLQINNTPGTTQ